MSAHEFNTHSTEDARAALVMVSGEKIELHKELIATRSRADYFEGEFGTAARTIGKLEWREAAVRQKLRRVSDAYVSVLDALREILDAQDPCETCDGTGGTPIERDVIARNGLEISHTETIGHNDPTDDPCEECAGVGFEIPDADELFQLACGKGNPAHRGNL